MKAIGEGRIAGRMAYSAIDHVPKININEPGKKMVTADGLTGHIEFKNVTFKYPSRPDLTVLKDFSEVFEAGKTTALVGPSGSGKSTVIQMLERFYDPENGDVLLDDMNIKDLNLTSYRSSIGYVS
jgi:ABC-type multidrug transport system fused ATPase/permease subunit